MMNEYVAIAENAAHRAGSFLLKQLDKTREIYYKSEDHKNPFSEVDLGAEKIILTTISDAFPAHSFLSEEGGGKESASDYKWVIDPLDGTINFNHHLRHFAVSISLLYKEKIITGVIYNPNSDEMFSAALGEGAYLNGIRMQVSNVSVLEESLIAVAFPYDRKSEAFHKSERNFLRLQRDSQAVRRAGSAALDLFNVACGRYDGFCVIGDKLWDYAAGILLVTEAGGKVTDFKGSPFTVNSARNEVLATNGEIHGIMLNCFKEEKTA
jgi:myo-inositol-1(or 4)-monophosphatase